MQPTCFVTARRWLRGANADRAFCNGNCPRIFSTSSLLLPTIGGDGAQIDSRRGSWRPPKHARIAPTRARCSRYPDAVGDARCAWVSLKPNRRRAVSNHDRGAGCRRMCCMGSWASRFPLFVDGAKGVVDEVARFLKSRVVGGSDRLARGVRSDERAAYTACQTIMLRCSSSRIGEVACKRLHGWQLVDHRDEPDGDGVLNVPDNSKVDRIAAQRIDQNLNIRRVPCT